VSALTPKSRMKTNQTLVHELPSVIPLALKVYTVTVSNNIKLARALIL
jgi:hypothetical protein